MSSERSTSVRPSDGLERRRTARPAVALNLVSLQSLRRHAKAGSLEVEHLLKEAVLRTPGLAAELQTLARDGQWASELLQADGSRLVPLARWAHVASAYADRGFGGLADLAQDEGYAAFVIGLLEEIHSREAVDALMTMFENVMANPERSPDIAHRLVVAINLLLSFRGSPRVADADTIAWSRFLERALAIADTNARRAGVMYAARGVADQRLLDVLASVPDAVPPFSGARAAAIRAIRKRLRNRT